MSTQSSNRGPATVQGTICESGPVAFAEPAEPPRKKQKIRTQPCWHFAQGVCTKGPGKCKFFHDPEVASQVVTASEDFRRYLIASADDVKQEANVLATSEMHTDGAAQLGLCVSTATGEINSHCKDTDKITAPATDDGEAGEQVYRDWLFDLVRRH
eukprot:gnl/TRDRNA2_/TRDRNA2_206560_c0_seq1.p1 gnl/TRDRNA2_/TRDRNA2_206560_c0~~gnl/TRDRNA2_/TRDRNA2_206560_c0_seq1.p1  ORF type:complete len:156 (+),score=17.66 gnl/TRDRNA2_/TRDRNA2_206560_c0_seq1:131-598(+)